MFISKGNLIIKNSAVALPQSLSSKWLPIMELLLNKQVVSDSHFSRAMEDIN